MQPPNALQGGSATSQAYRRAAQRTGGQKQGALTPRADRLASHDSKAQPGPATAPPETAGKVRARAGRRRSSKSVPRTSKIVGPRYAAHWRQHCRGPAADTLHAAGGGCGPARCAGLSCRVQAQERCLRVRGLLARQRATAATRRERQRPQSYRGAQAQECCDPRPRAAGGGKRHASRRLWRRLGRGTLCGGGRPVGLPVRRLVRVLFGRGVRRLVRIVGRVVGRLVCAIVGRDGLRSLGGRGGRGGRADGRPGVGRQRLRRGGRGGPGQ
mmetsp:Transcript_90660/g.277587  ORF Transcript_90660/g.277587 Transcript_90660/m.277587 type:complete len:270 (+) Transcript_90660:176-985(+)